MIGLAPPASRSIAVSGEAAKLLRCEARGSNVRGGDLTKLSMWVLVVPVWDTVFQVVGRFFFFHIP